MDEQSVVVQETSIKEKLMSPIYFSTSGYPSSVATV